MRASVKAAIAVAATALGVTMLTTLAPAASAAPAGNAGPVAAPTFTPKGDWAGDRVTENAAPLNETPLPVACWNETARWWCVNAYGAPVYLPGTAYPTASLTTTKTAFVCRVEGSRNNTGRHPYRWEWTQASNGLWGWVRDGDIASETDTLPVCR
ncbi:hypothetical protein Ssi03_46510 [Sphaerisporangium siamense]|uniref:SH3 domain-containing protein n=1 Tax=Sphaerisporangium siamense TaxID=795645 RepID=A0A7W7D2S0_9ACTN|nr:hypothetical protein [Sphaerisporangium siamense]MBB4699212.1 hypothetical protein [Sphaerisporangium siamense]GII86661.1 hypothetical protein Ssi03_46510 [Sphaerisporangium siamense]